MSLFPRLTRSIKIQSTNTILRFRFNQINTIRMSSSNPSNTNPSTTTNTNPTSQQPEQTPSMLAAHGQYAKGYVSETIGNLTGSKEWQESGKKDAKEGIEGMKAANAQRKADPAPSGVLGKAEELAGKATGCEGMEKEGVVRQEKAQ